MRTLVITILLAVCCLYTSSEARRSKRCEWYEYYNRSNNTCAECGTCPKGTFVSKICSQTRDIKCEKCPEGTYANHDTKVNGRCRSCTSCGLKNTIKNCTSTSDTVCGDCPIGTYYDVFTLTCQVCSFCFPDYTDKKGKNFYLSKDCAKPQIPPDFQCVVTRNPPFLPPKLKSKEVDSGILFYTDGSQKNSNFEEYYDYYYDDEAMIETTLAPSKLTRTLPPLLFYHGASCIITIGVATLLILIFIFIMFKCFVHKQNLVVNYNKM